MKAFIIQGVALQNAKPFAEAAAKNKATKAYAAIALTNGVDIH
jgi:hypothetical protein